MFYLNRFKLILVVHFRKFFSLDPPTLKIGAGEKMEMTITGLSNKATSVKEMWYMTGNIEGINKKELLLECPILAEFVEPKLELSSNILEFRYDKGPYGEHHKLTGKVIFVAVFISSFL